MILFFIYCSLLDEGVDLYKKGEFDNALKKIERFLLNEEGDKKTIPLALYLAGKLNKEEKKALEYYNKLLEKYPESEYGDEALYEIAQYWYTKEDFIKAMQKYKDIIMLYPKGPYANKAKDWIKLIAEFVFVQLGYFSIKNNAKRLAERAKFNPYKVYILEDKNHYRVWLGIFNSIEEAKKFINKFKIEGIIKRIE